MPAMGEYRYDLNKLNNDLSEFDSSQLFEQRRRSMESMKVYKKTRESINFENYQRRILELK